MDQPWVLPRQPKQILLMLQAGATQSWTLLREVTKLLLVLKVHGFVGFCSHLRLNHLPVRESRSCSDAYFDGSP